MIKRVFVWVVGLAVVHPLQWGYSARVDEILIGPSLEMIEGVLSLSVRPQKGELELRSQGQFLKYGDTFLTGDHGTVRLAFEQGVQILVAPHTSIRVSQEQGEVDSLGVPVIQVDRGEIRALVEKIPENYMNPNTWMHRFFVLTPSATFAARGTDFVIQAEKGRSQVYVFTGAVDAAKDRAAISRAELVGISGGESLQVSQGGHLGKPVHFEVKAFLSDLGNRNPRFPMMWRAAAESVKNHTLSEKFERIRSKLTHNLNKNNRPKIHLDNAEAESKWHHH